MATPTTKTSLEAIPLLKGRQNYTSWSKQMESHLKASNAWEIISGKWKKPLEPSYFEAPLRPQDLIAEHRARRQEEENAQAKDPEETPLPPYTPLSLRDAKEELEYIKAHIEQWNRWNKTFPLRQPPKRKGTKPFEMIHIDLLTGPEEALDSHYKYLLVIIDDYTRYSWYMGLNPNTSRKPGRNVKHAFFGIMAMETKHNVLIKRIRSRQRGRVHHKGYASSMES